MRLGLCVADGVSDWLGETVWLALRVAEGVPVPEGVALWLRV